MNNVLCLISNFKILITYQNDSYFAYIGLNKIIIKVNFTTFPFFKTMATKKQNLCL